MNRNTIKILFAIRICLWIVIFVSTAYWIYYSVKMHRDGIYDVYEYATLLRPVLYPCLIISIIAICISFALHALTVRIRKRSNS